MLRREQSSVNAQQNNLPLNHWFEMQSSPFLIDSGPENALDVLTRAIAATGNGLIITCANGSDNPIIYCNPAFSDLTGYAEEDVLGRDCRFLQGPETDTRAVEKVRSALCAGLGCRSVLLNYKKDGTAFWNDLLISPMRNDQGVLTHWIGVQTDVSDLKETQAALAASNERVINILESMTDGFFALDSGWRFTYVNPQAEPLLQMRRDELLGKTIWEVFPEAIGSRFYQEYRRAMATHTTAGFAEYDRRLDTWFEVRAYPTQDGLAVYLRDITHRKRAEEERQYMLARQRAFLRDVLASVTEGKLRLCDSPADLPEPLPRVGDMIPLSISGGLRELRRRTVEAAENAGLATERRHDLMTAVSEAGMNAIVHAGVGVGSVGARDGSPVQVRVDDQGAGIAVENLPKATLAFGYSTASTMGHGFKMMLQTVDRLWLLTSPRGTTVVMEQDRVRCEPWLWGS